MENPAIARVLGEIADLLEIKGANPFRIRAYRNAAGVAADSAERLADLSLEALLELPGIGKDLALKIHELAERGTLQYHQELLAEFPPTLLELLTVQGVGPKTVALLHQTLQIASLDQLEAAARAGALRGLKGMGARKEQLILKALEERRQFVGRHLLADTDEVAGALLAHLREAAPKGVTLDAVGSLRRGCETCGDLDILATGAVGGLMEHFTRYRLVDRVLGQGETKSSVLLAKGFQADLRLVPPDSRGAALQYFTGSKPHNIALRDRALQRKLRLNEYGLFETGTERRIAGDTEESIYEALGLPWIPPELREHRGEIEAGDAGSLPRLIERADLRGDLHMHSDATDGRDTVEDMARAARDAGLEYVAITDHSQALAMANGLDERRALAHARRIRQISERIEGITVLAGIECDIRADGTLDLAEDCLAQLDFVVASVHSAFNQEAAQMTDRLLKAIESPHVDALGHPTGRLLLRRDAYRLDLEAVIEAAANAGVALEINGQADRMDLNDVQARLARQRGVKIILSSDAHSRRALDLMRWSLIVARRAWLEPGDVLNTLPLTRLRAALRRHRAPGKASASKRRAARAGRS